MMKHLLLTLSSLLLLAFSAYAQGPGNKPSWKERQQQQAAQLQLSEQQQKQWDALLEQFGPQFQTMHDEAAQDKSERRAKADALREQYMQQRNAILTDAQRQQLKDMRPEKRGHKGKKGGKCKGCPNNQAGAAPAAE